MATSPNVFVGRVFDAYGHPDRGCSTNKMDIKDIFYMVAYTVKDGELGKMYVNGSFSKSNSLVVKKISKSKNPLLI